MEYLVALYLPVLILLAVFGLLVRKGFRKKFLIAAFVFGLLNCLPAMVNGGGLESALWGGVVSFLFFYILLDLIYRLVSRIQKSKKPL